MVTSTKANYWIECLNVQVLILLAIVDSLRFECSRVFNGCRHYAKLHEDGCTQFEVGECACIIGLESESETRTLSISTQVTVASRQMQVKFTMDSQANPNPNDRMECYIVNIGIIEFSAKLLKEGQNQELGASLNFLSMKFLLECLVAEPHWKTWVKLLGLPFSLQKLEGTLGSKMGSSPWDPPP